MFPFYFKGILFTSLSALQSFHFLKTAFQEISNQTRLTKPKKKNPTSPVIWKHSVIWKLLASVFWVKQWLEFRSYSKMCLLYWPIACHSITMGIMGSLLF